MPACRTGLDRGGGSRDGRRGSRARTEGAQASRGSVRPRGDGGGRRSERARHALRRHRRRRLQSADGGATWAALDPDLCRDVRRRARDRPLRPLDGLGRHLRPASSRRPPTASGAWRSRPEWAASSSARSRSTRPRPRPSTPARAAAIFKSRDGGATWSEVDRGLTNQFVTTLAIDPSRRRRSTRPPTAAASSRARTAGRAGRPSNDGLKSMIVLALAIDPTVRGHALRPDRGGHLQDRRTAASSWAPVNNGLASRFTLALAIDPASSATLYAGTASGVFKQRGRRRDLGRGERGPDEPVHDGRSPIDPSSPGVVYAGTDGGLFKTTDGGTGWIELKREKDERRAAPGN